MNIGRAIKITRQERKIKQQDLAGKVSTSNSYLSRVENGFEWPSHKLVEQIAVILQVSPGLLYFRALDKQDVPYNKQQLFDALYPTIQHIIGRLV